MTTTFIRPTMYATRPTVSVVVPCYNYGHYLPSLIQGLNDQPQITIDVTIVNDASPDNSAEIAQDLANQYPWVRVIQHSQNQGHIQTYNDGLSGVQGKYVVLLSADDYLPRGALTRAVSLMEARPDVGLVYGYSQSFSGDVPLVGDEVRNWSVWAGIDWLRLASRRGRCFIASPEVVMRSSAFRQTAGYDRRLPHSADFDMWLQTSLRWNIGRVNGPPQAFYRVHDSNMHLTTFAGMITDLRERRRTFEILFTEHAPNRSEVVSLRGAAMRALSRESARLACRGYRDGLQVNEISDYLMFARETWPGITRTATWQSCVVGPIVRRQYPLIKARRFGSRVRDHVKWRRWRRYGT